MRQNAAIIFFSVLIIILAISAKIGGAGGEDRPEPERPFRIVLPVETQPGKTAAVADAVQSAPERGAGMSYADDISDAHDPSLAAGFNPRTLHGKIRSEPRDPAWAPRSEDNLRSAIADSLFSHPATDIHINCARSLCEARGLLRAAQGSAQARSAIDLLQSGELVNRLASNGQAFVTISSARRPNGTAFFLYSRRIG